MKKLAVIAAAFFFSVVPTHAQKRIWVGNGPDPLANKIDDQTALFNRLKAIRKTLPVPSDWHIVLVSEAEWTATAPKNTETAYSDFATGFTFLRASYAVSAQDSKLRHTLAHEMGHRICDCSDEDVAEREANKILQGEIR